MKTAIYIILHIIGAAGLLFTFPAIFPFNLHPFFAGMIGGAWLFFCVVIARTSFK